MHKWVSTEEWAWPMVGHEGMRISATAKSILYCPGFSRDRLVSYLKPSQARVAPGLSGSAPAATSRCSATS